MRNLIIGKGEVGQSLYNVLKDAHETEIRDREPFDATLPITVLNICFPYFDGFEDAVREYQKEYAPEMTIIHSTVPVGTSDKLGAVHSPIHGKHPNLEGGIRTFIKYVGCADRAKAEKARDFLNMAMISTVIVDDARTSEASKIWCTTYYGTCIAFMKEVEEFCKANGLNFEQVYGWNALYNRGYGQLDMKHFTRPVLTPMQGGIGGHCVMQNLRFIEDNPVAKFIKQVNAKYDTPQADK